MKASDGDEDLAAYLKDIGNIPLLSDDEEIALAKRIEQGDASAIDALISANLRPEYSVEHCGELPDLETLSLIMDVSVKRLEDADAACTANRGRRADEAEMCSDNTAAQGRAAGEDGYLIIVSDSSTQACYRKRCSNDNNEHKRKGEGDIPPKSEITIPSTGDTEIALCEHTTLVREDDAFNHSICICCQSCGKTITLDEDAQYNFGRGYLAGLSSVVAQIGEAFGLAWGDEVAREWVNNRTEREARENNCR